MKKLLLFVFCTLLIFKTDLVSAQSDYLFHSFGGSISYTTPPAFSFASHAYLNSSNVEVTRYGKFHGFGISGHYNLRINLHKFSEEKAIGLNIQPGICVSFFKIKYTSYPADDKAINEGIVGRGNIIIPVYLTMEFGAGSTYLSSKNSGYVLGLGMQYFTGPLVSEYEQKISPDKLKSSYVEPILYAGIRYWDLKNRLSEMGFRVGFGPSKDYQETSTDPVKKSASMSFQLTWTRLINY